MMVKRAATYTRARIHTCTSFGGRFLFGIAYRRHRRDFFFLYYIIKYRLSPGVLCFRACDDCTRERERAEIFWYILYIHTRVSARVQQRVIVDGASGIAKNRRKRLENFSKRWYTKSRWGGRVSLVLRACDAGSGVHGVTDFSVARRVCMPWFSSGWCCIRCVMQGIRRNML